MAESLDVPLGDINGISTDQGEHSSYENDLVINEMESYMYEADTAILITRFEEDISRFVTYSVIKGFIRDLEQDIARQIASKDEEITLLNQKAQQLGNGTLSFSEARDKRYDEVSSLRQELSTISKSLLNFEWGLPVVQYNSEGAEDVSIKHRGKDNSSRNGPAKEDEAKASAEEVFGDRTYLAHMDKDALITHFNKEMNKMKRQHDSAVQEKTEEIFRLKRELLKKEGSNPWHLRNNKEFEQMRKKIGEVISKLDGLLLENNNYKRTTSGIKAEIFHGQQDTLNVVDSEIQQIQGASSNNEEACTLPSQALHVASIEADHLKQIGMLESDIEDIKVATVIREEIERIAVKEFMNEIKMRLNGCEMEYNVKHEICSVIQNEAIVEAMVNINSSWLKFNEEKSCSEAIFSQNQEIEKLKLAVDSFNEVLTEKEKFMCQFELGALKGRMDLLCHQLNLLADKVEKQGTYLSEKTREFDVIVGRLEQALQQARLSEINLRELHDRFRTVTESLKEVEKENQALCTVIEEKEKRNQNLCTIIKEKEKQNQNLCTIIKEKEKIFTSSVSKEELMKSMISVGKCMREFERFVTDQQTVIANKVQHSELRFSLLKEQCKHLTQESSLLKKKALRYKEISETRGSNLQKAELEVDLLGDEVEALTDLLAKIYIALDHYSPVLQHYTGVMETLNMIKKHISMAK